MSKERLFKSLLYCTRNCSSGYSNSAKFYYFIPYFIYF